MDFIWKVELPIIERSSKEATNTVFDLLGIPNFHTVYPIKDNADAREWYQIVSNACIEQRDKHFGTYRLGEIEGHSIILKDVLPRFSRYEQKQFLLIVLRYNNASSITDTLIEDNQLKLSAFLKQRFGQHVIDDFSVKIKIEGYVETIKIQNPIPVILNNDSQNPLPINEKNKCKNFFRHGKCSKASTI